MVMDCSFCGKRTNKSAAGRTFHHFPLHQPEVLQSWLKNINLGSDFTPTKTMRLCSDHFQEECFQKTKIGVKLVPGSVPTIFGTYKSACAYCSAVKTNEDQRSFHKFPLRNPKLLESWITAMGKENYNPCETSQLCSDHFESKCFRPSGYGTSQRLRKNAIPTMFLPIVPEGTTKMTEKRAHDSSHEGPPAKLARTDCQRVSAPYTKDDLAFSHSTDALASEQECESMGTFDPIEPVPAAVSIETASFVPMERPTTPVLPSTLNHDGQPTTSGTARHINIVNHDHHYETTPKTLRKKLALSRKKIQTLQKEARVQKQKITRLKKKISSLKDIVSELRRTRALPESGLACLDSIAETDVSQFLKRFAKNQKNISEMSDKKPLAKKKQWKSITSNRGSGISREKYPPALRSFAMTLHFYSPRAYAFVRRKFCNALPDPSTLRSWYSTIDGEPGFTTESFEALKIKVSEAKKVGKEVLVSFMLDEMGIKKGMQTTPKGTVRGYVDLGSDMETSGLVPLAKDALVMMAVSLDCRWKIPVGYFFINGIDSNTNAGLVTDCLVRLNDIGVKVVSVTLDGPSGHFSTMKILGAQLSMPNPKPYFPHPSTGEKVYVIFDACHMLKLARNCLGDVKIMKDSERNLIEWRFIEALAKLQDQEGLRAGNRLRMAHIRYEKMKMKVALAAQTLSSSVADTILFCGTDLGLPEFKGSQGTIRFIRCIDRLFDFLNSRNPFANGYKAPLRRSNEDFWRPQILSELEYLKGVTDVAGRPMWSTPKYVAFVGFITGVMSVLGIFDMYVKLEESQLKYLLTYKLSQDHLELFFCAVRSCGGWCPNPTCTQFVSAYKRLLVHHEVTTTNGNVEAIDSTRVLTVSSRSSRQKQVDRYDPDVYNIMDNVRVQKKYGLGDEEENDSDCDKFLDEFLHFHRKLPESLSQFSRACVANIGGWVVKKLVDPRKPVVRCEKCRDSLFQNSQTSAEFDDNALVEAKTRGGLIFPSKSVVLICQRAEHLFRHALNKNKCMTPIEANFPAVLCAKVMGDLLQTPGTLFPELNNHLFDDAVEELSNHVYSLTKHVCKTYIQLRLYAATNLASEAAIGTKIRHHMTRRIVWSNQ